jgi:hypothetical protein
MEGLPTSVGHVRFGSKADIAATEQCLLTIADIRAGSDYVRRTNFTSSLVSNFAAARRRGSKSEVAPDTHEVRTHLGPPTAPAFHGHGLI